MRLPDFHPLVLALVDKLGLKRRLFYNVDVKRGTGDETAPAPAVEYRSFTGATWRRGPDVTSFRAPEQASRTWLHLNGEQVRRHEYAADPTEINRSFGVPESRRHVTAGQLLDAALDPVRDYYSTVTNGERVNKPVPEWIEGWAALIYDLDRHSMGSFLTEAAGFDDRTIDLVGTMENLTSRMPLAFLHSFLTRSLVNAKATYWELDGGTAELVTALLPLLKDEIRMNRRMIRLEHGKQVRVETTSESGGDDADAGTTAPETEWFTADVAVVTVPFPALRHVEITPQLPYEKRRAISELHYDVATKVLLEFTRRWWEFSEEDWKRELEAIEPGLYERYGSTREATAVVGGGSTTDGPNRFTYVPSHPIDGSAGGVVLASYSWADDASRWDGLDDDERYAYALRGMQVMFGQRIEAFYSGRGQTQSWLRNRYAIGEAAVFAPRQFTELHPYIPGSVGPVHFAGEHTSLKHSWIEGALESAVRTALEVNGA